MDDTKPSDIATRIEEYLTTNEAFQLTNISVRFGHQEYEFRQYRYNAVDWYDKGNALAGIGKYQEAIESYNKGLEINPNYAFAWTNKGNALYYLGKYQEAIQCFDKAIELDPNLVEPWNNKGLSLDALGRHNEAIEYYNKAKD